MENDGKIITAKYVGPNYEIRKVTYVAQESIDEISNAVAKKINELLTAEKKGKWVYDEERGATGIYAICTVCNEIIYQTGEFNYCPNCGAKMDGGEE